MLFCSVGVPHCIEKKFEGTSERATSQHCKYFTSSDSKMSATTVSKKRKSAGETVSAPKKVKTSKSADKPAPAKSSLKQTMKTIAAHTTAVPNSTKASSGRAVKSHDATEAPQIEDGEEGGATLTPDQTNALLAGFSSSEDDASDAETEGIALSKVPAAPTTGAIQKRIRQAIATKEVDAEHTPSVIYIGRVPHGFYEQQLRAYLSQFGDILNLRLARNRKTGKSQHFAFVEFASAAVAQIVAKTMDKYLLFGHILQVRIVPREQVKESLFKGRRKRPAPHNRLEAGRLGRGMVREAWEKRVEREEARRADKAKKLEELGYAFEMPSVKAVKEVPVKAKQIEAAPVHGVGIEETTAVESAPPEVIGAATPGDHEPEGIEVVEQKKATKKRPAADKKVEKASKKAKK